MLEPQKYNFGDIEDAHQSFTSRFAIRPIYDFGDIPDADETAPDWSVKRWFGAVIEGSKDAARWLSRSQRLHAQYDMPKERTDISNPFEAQRLTPGQRQRIAQRISERTVGSIAMPANAAEIQKATRDVVLEDKQAAVTFFDHLEKLPALQTAPEFEGVSSGIIEDILRTMPASAPGLVGTLVSPAVGTPVIYETMLGAISESAEKQGAIEERAYKAGQVGAVISTPFEMLGDALQIRAMFPGSGRWLTRLLLAGEAFGGEALTEYLQEYPETGASIWALNPDLSADELIYHLGDTFTSAKFQKEALYSGLIGGLSGLGTVGAVQGSAKLADYLVTDKQQRINREKNRRFAEIVGKPDPTVDDIQELVELTGMPPAAVNRMTQDMEAEESIRDTVEKIRARVMFQADPIKSESRDQIRLAVESHRNFTREQADAYLAIWDGVAYSLVESGDIKAPGEFYDMWSFAPGGEFQDVDGVVYQQGQAVTEPKFKPVDTSSKEFRRWFGGSEVVDDDGAPIIAYHGTDAKFDVFDAGKWGQTEDGDFGGGFYFHTQSGYAKRYGKNVMPVYLSIKNPMPASDYTGQAVEDIIGDGYDGIIEYTDDGGIGRIVAFSPKQIKSAISNTGEFSESDARIMFKMGAATVPEQNLNAHHKQIKSQVESITKDWANADDIIVRKHQSEIHPALLLQTPDAERVNELRKAILDNVQGKKIPSAKIWAAMRRAIREYKGFLSEFKNAGLVRYLYEHREDKFIDVDDALNSMVPSFARGGAFLGKIYIVSENTVPDTVEHTLFHEVNHVGIELIENDQVMGPRYKRWEQDLISTRKDDLSEIADEYRLDMRSDKDRKIAAKEWLSRQAEKGKPDNLFYRFVRMVRDWARRVFKGLRVSDQEAYAWIADVRNKAVRGQAETRQLVEAPALSKSDQGGKLQPMTSKRGAGDIPTNQTPDGPLGGAQNPIDINSAEFKAWYGDGPVLRYYHAGRSEVREMSPDHGGGRTPVAGVMFFSDDPRVSDSYLRASSFDVHSTEEIDERLNFAIKEAHKDGEWLDIDSAEDFHSSIPDEDDYESLLSWAEDFYLDDSRITPAYITTKNVRVLEIDADGGYFNEITSFRNNARFEYEIDKQLKRLGLPTNLFYTGEPISTDEIARIAKENNIDVVKIKNVNDTGSWGTEPVESTVVIVTNPKAVKFGLIGLPNQSPPPGEAGMPMLSKVSAKPQYQSAEYTQSPRGLIENLFTDQPAIMRAFASADPSTPIHETGHFLTKVLQQYRPQDYQVMAEWAGVDTDRTAQGLAAWTDDELEKVARGFERYIMEGRAPTMRLQSVFRKLKQWLIKIYKTVRTLDAEISDDVRRVFDRLVSTEEERANDPVYEVLEWFLVDDPAFSTPSEADLSYYENIAAQARRKVLGKMQDRRKADEKRLSGEFRKTAKEMVDELDIYQVMNDVVGAGGLHYDTIKARHGQGMIEDLIARRPGIVSRTGVEPDQLAHAWGYQTSDDMIADMLRSESRKAAEERLYNDMWAEYEHFLTEDHVDIYDQVLDAEIEIIEGMLGKKPAARKDLKPTIRRQTGQVKPAEYRQLRDALKRDEKTAREAYRAAMKDLKTEQDFEAAKRRQKEYLKRLDHLKKVARLKYEQKQKVYRIRKAVKDSRERAKITRRMKRYLRMKPKSLPVDYKEQVVDIIGRYFALPKRYQGVKPQEDLEAVLARAEAEGENVDVPRMIAREKLPSPRGYGETMPIEDLQIVAQLVDSLVHLGRTKGKLVSLKEKQDLEETVLRLVDQISDAHTMDLEKTPWEIIDEYRKRLTGVKEQARTFFAQIEKPEFIFRALDGWEDLGPVWSELFGRMKAAEDHEMTLGADYVARIKAAFDRAGANRKWANELFEIEVGEDTVQRRKEELIMIALNSGNDGNRAALIGGYGFTDEQIDAVVDMLTPKEKQLVNDIWNILDSLFPLLEDVHLKHTGARLAKVDGRYFPLIFDRKLSLTADKFAAERELKDLFASEYHMTRPEWGHRKERKGGTMAPRLEFSVIQRHLQKTIHDVTHQLHIRDAQRIIAHPRFRDAVNRSLGKEVYSQLMPWLQDIARPRSEPISQIDNWIGKIRRNTTTVGLGLKVSVALKQQLSLTQTIDAVGLMPTLAGMKEFYAGPRDVIRRVNQMSPAMRFRRNSWDRELRQHYESFDALSIGWTDSVRDAYFAMIQLMDLMATYPSWLAGYSKGLEKFNGDRDKAADFADMIVRTTQPAASPKDLSWIQRGGKTRSELHKSLTMFYTFFAVFANRMHELHRRFGARDVSTTELIKSYWWLVIAPAILGGVISRGGLRDDKDDEARDIAKTLAKDIAGYYVGGVPYVRDFVNGFMTDYGYSLSPIEGAGQSVEYFAKGLPKLDPRRSVKGAIKVGGYALGLPSAQVNITLDGMLDLAAGETDDITRLLFRKKKGE